MTKKYVIMCVGHTHTGKTTFAKKLSKKFPNFQIIDNDEIAVFLNKHYHTVVFSDYNKKKRSYKEPNLKFLISQEIFEFCLRAGLNVIHSSCNLGKDARSALVRNSKKYNYKTITIYFNLPKSVILKRIKDTKKDTNCLRTSKNWHEVLVMQEGYAELPPAKNSDVYFEINNDRDYKRVFIELSDLLKRT